VLSATSMSFCAASLLLAPRICHLARRVCHLARRVCFERDEHVWARRMCHASLRKLTLRFGDTLRKSLHHALPRLSHDNVNVHRAAAQIIVPKSRAARGSVCNVLLSRQLPARAKFNLRVRLSAQLSVVCSDYSLDWGVNHAPIQFL